LDGPRLEMCKSLFDDGYSASQIAVKIGGVTRNAVIGIIHRKGWGGQKGSPGSPTARIITVRKRREGKGDTGGGAANAVNAKARRLKVRGHGGFGVDLDAGATSVPLLEINPIEDFDIMPAQRKTLLELTADTCRWPVGDPASPDFFFCGARPFSGSPYCPCHAGRAYDAAGNTASAQRWAARGVNYFANR
jgi:GcrA cell cycle regulator